MNELQVFTNPEFGQVRTVTIEEEPWFVGKDVAGFLGDEKPRGAGNKEGVPGDKRGSGKEKTSREQQKNHINGIGLYFPIFGNKAERAQNHQK